MSDVTSDDDWLEQAIHDAGRTQAHKASERRDEHRRDAEATTRADRNASTHSAAVTQVRSAIGHARKVLAENGNPGMTQLFRYPGLFRQHAWGWQIELPPQSIIPEPSSDLPRITVEGALGRELAQGGPRLYIRSQTSEAIGAAMEGQVNGLPEALWLINSDGFTTRIGQVVDGRDCFTDNEFVDLVLPAQVLVSRIVDDNHSVSDQVDIFPLVNEDTYKHHALSIARRLSAGLILMLQKHGPSSI
jgi:hypothetical protein